MWSGFEDTLLNLQELDDKQIANLAKLEAKRAAASAAAAAAASADAKAINSGRTTPKHGAAPTTPKTPSGNGTGSAIDARKHHPRSASGSWASASASAAPIVSAPVTPGGSRRPPPSPGGSSNRPPLASSAAGGGSSSNRLSRATSLILSTVSSSPTAAARTLPQPITPNSARQSAASPTAATGQYQQTPASPATAFDGATYATPMAKPNFNAAGSTPVLPVGSSAINYRRGTRPQRVNTANHAATDDSFAFDDGDAAAGSTAVTTVVNGGTASSALSTPSGSHLSMRAVMEMHNKQALINQASSQLHAMNFFMNYCNATRSRRLESNLIDVRRDLDAGQLLLAQLRTTVSAQQTSMDTLTTTVQTMDAALSRHQQMMTLLAQTMDEQKRVLSESVASQNQKIEYQHSLIQQQSSLLSKLVSVRFRLDFVVDVSIVFVSHWISGSTPLKIALYVPAVALSPVYIVLRAIIRVVLRAVGAVFGIPFIPISAFLRRIRDRHAAISEPAIQLINTAVKGTAATAATAAVASPASAAASVALQSGGWFARSSVRRAVSGRARLPSPPRLIYICLRLGVFVYGVCVMREIAARFGLHSVIGSFSEYAAIAISTIRSILRYLRSWTAPYVNRLRDAYPDTVAVGLDRTAEWLQPVWTAIVNRVPVSVFDTLQNMQQPTPQSQAPAQSQPLVSPNSTPAAAAAPAAGVVLNSCAPDSASPYPLISMPPTAAAGTSAAAGMPLPSAPPLSSLPSVDVKDAVSGAFSVVRSSVPVVSAQFAAAVDRSRTVASSVLSLAWNKFHASVLE